MLSLWLKLFRKSGEMVAIELLFIIMGAVVCLTGIFGGMALIMKIAERAYIRDLAKSNIIPPSLIKSPFLQRKAALYLDALSMLEEYQGKFVAISNGTETTAIASEDTYSDLMKAASKAAKETFCVFFVPKVGVIYSR